MSSITRCHHKNTAVPLPSSEHTMCKGSLQVKQNLKKITNNANCSYQKTMKGQNTDKDVPRIYLIILKGWMKATMFLFHCRWNSIIYIYFKLGRQRGRVG